jgi:hypothetical protein
LVSNSLVDGEIKGRHYVSLLQNEGSVELKRPAADKEKATEVPGRLRFFSSLSARLSVLSAVALLLTSDT